MAFKQAFTGVKVAVGNTLTITTFVILSTQPLVVVAVNTTLYDDVVVDVYVYVGLCELLTGELSPKSQPHVGAPPTFALVLVLVKLLKVLAVPKHTLVGVKSGMAWPHTFTGNNTVSLQPFTEVTINEALYVPDDGYTNVGAFATLSIDPLLV